jgi:OmcA/MtrC family decaheme c-type cytochrome
VHDYSEIEFTTDLKDCEVCHTGGTPTEDFPMVADPAPGPSCDSSGHTMTKLTWGDAGSVEVRLDTADGTLLTSRSGAGDLVTGQWVNDNMAFLLVDADSGETIQSVTPHTTVFGCVNNPPAEYIESVAATDHDVWMTNPSRMACGSCHDTVDFETDEGHPQMLDDESCSFCHRATGNEYGFSVAGAHTVNYQSAQLGGVLVQVVDISNIGPGQRPIVTFSLGNKWGPLPPSYLGRLRFSLSGPNEDFSFYAQDDALDALQPSGNNWTFQFETPLPSDATGSYSLGVEGRITNWVMNEGKANEFTMNDQMQNFIEPFAVTGDSIMSRREVVDDTKCESCHGNLSLHGSNRHDATGYCQTCHMPSATDEDERLEGIPVTIDFRMMVHKIHRGADLENGYVVYGHNNSVNDFSNVHYVGDLRNCEACHVNESYMLPLPDGLLPVTTPAAQFTPMLPETASCLSCHDGGSAASHALSNTSELGEACATCHGTGKTYSVEAVHAR